MFSYLTLLYMSDYSIWGKDYGIFQFVNDGKGESKLSSSRKASLLEHSVSKLGLQTESLRKWHMSLCLNMKQLTLPWLFQVEHPNFHLWGSSFFIGAIFIFDHLNHIKSLRLLFKCHFCCVPPSTFEWI